MLRSLGKRLIILTAGVFPVAEVSVTASKPDAVGVLPDTDALGEFPESDASGVSSNASRS
jgi:hypothetical protein